MTIPTRRRAQTGRRRPAGGDPARGANPPLVVIDPGHGGRDPGATSPFGATRGEGHHARARPGDPRRARRDRAGSGSRMTREDDRYLVLDDRYGIARRLDADLFISIHADAAPRTTRRAAPPSTPCPRSPPTARRPCSPQRRTQADRIGGARLSPDPNVNLILIDLAQRESMNVSADFARLLHREAAPDLPVPARLAPLRRLHRAEGARHPLDPVRIGLSHQRGRRRLHPLGRRAAARSPTACAARSRPISRGGCLPHGLRAPL